MKQKTTSLNTKWILAKALKDSMKAKPFSKITVSEIVKKCGLNRKTFYYHFEDIYSLLKWMLEEEALNIVKNFDLMENYEDAIYFTIDYIEKNDYILNCAYDSLGREGMKHFFYLDFRDIIMEIIQFTESSFHAALDTEYRNFLCRFYTEALAGILIEWIKNKDLRNPDEIVSYIVRTIKQSLIGIFNNPK